MDSMEAFNTSPVYWSEREGSKFHWLLGIVLFHSACLASYPYAINPWLAPTVLQLKSECMLEATPCFSVNRCKTPKSESAHIEFTFSKRPTWYFMEVIRPSYSFLSVSSLLATVDQNIWSPFRLTGHQPWVNLRFGNLIIICLSTAAMRLRRCKHPRNKPSASFAFNHTK